MDTTPDNADGAKPAGQRYVYNTSWPSYAMSWSPVKTDAWCRIAVGSFIDKSEKEEAKNSIQIVELNQESKRLEVVAEFEHQYPATKLLWSEHKDKELLASSSTLLNIYAYEDGKVVRKAKLQNNRRASGKENSGKEPGDASPPLTSFDWSTVNSHKVGASSVDTTCTIWNIEAERIVTQLIAHDKAVHDIAFSSQDNLFASVGADGSVRLFDQRNLDHSTIIYEAQPLAPLLRLAWNKYNNNLLATVSKDSPGVILIDVRRPSVALATLSTRHESCVNNIAWSPISKYHLLAGTADGSAVIWDVKNVPVSKEQNKAEKLSPVLAYETDQEIYQVQWPSTHSDWVALGSTNRIEVLQL